MTYFSVTVMNLWQLHSFVLLVHFSKATYIKHDIFLNFYLRDFINASILLSRTVEVIAVVIKLYKEDYKYSIKKKNGFISAYLSIFYHKSNVFLFLPRAIFKLL